jgi:hypothetical protein
MMTGDRSKGCGIVEFSNSEEADYAIARLTDTELKGRYRSYHSSTSTVATVFLSHRSTRLRVMDERHAGQPRPSIAVFVTAAALHVAVTIPLAFYPHPASLALALALAPLTILLRTDPSSCVRIARAEIIALTVAAADGTAVVAPLATVVVVAAITLGAPPW